MLSETIQFIVIFAVTVVFSAFALVLEDKNYTRLVLKVIAGVFWFIMAVTQIYFFGGTQLLAVPLMLMFAAVGLFYCFSIVNDFKTQKHERIWDFDEY